MRPSFALAFALVLLPSVFVSAQTMSSQTPPPQTARQALIEMFFGQSANHLEKHLPDVTRRTFQKLGDANGQSYLSEFSMLASQAKAGGAKIETYDTGPALLTAEAGSNERVEIIVERDDLAGDEDQIELALHMTRGKEETTSPFIPRFTFAMKMESDVWRLNEVSVTVRLPLADPDFLKRIEDQQRGRNEQVTIWSMRTVISAEKSYQFANGGFACTLPALGSASKGAGSASHAYLYDSELASGKKNGYIFAISGCDASHYQVVAEPAAPGAGQRAFCSDESGTIRASADGKATTCLSSGEAVDTDKIQGVNGAVGISR